MLAPLIKHRKGTHQNIIEEIRKAGFVRARVDGEIIDIGEEEIELDRYKNHTIEAVVDRLVLRQHEVGEEADNFRSRLTDSVETALQFGDGMLTIHNLSAEPPSDTNYSEHLACPVHDISIPEIEPRTFSLTPLTAPVPNARASALKWKLTLSC